MLKQTTALFAIIVLCACEAKDLAYYQSNLDAAKKKFELCEKTLESSFESENERKIEAIMEDPECRAAETAHKDNEIAIAKLAQKTRQQEEKKKREEEERLFASKLAEQKKALAEVSIDEFYAAQQSCQNDFRGATCKAFHEMKEERDAKEVDHLIASHPKEKLEAYTKERCQGIRFSNIHCKLAQTAQRKQTKDVLAFYDTNREQLKSDYNSCYKRIKTLNKAKKYNQAQEVADTYTCKMTGSAAARLGVYHFSKPL